MSDRQVPDTWQLRRLGDCLTLQNGHAFKQTDWSKSGDPIIRIQNLNATRGAAFNYYEGELPERFRARQGDLLFAWSGTPGTSFGAHVWDGGDAWINQHIFRVGFSHEDFDRDFLRLALNFNLGAYVAGAQGGVGLAHITKAKLNDSLLVAPPLIEQRDIARAISAAEEKRHSAIVRLQSARRVVGRLHRAVLAAACSGRLTADWRALRRNETWAETGSTTPLIDAPDEWSWTTLGEIAAIQGGIQVGAKRRPGEALREVPYLRVANVQRGWLDLKEVKTILATEAKIAALALQPGDIFFNEGGDRDKLGRGWVWEGQLPECIHQNHVFRARLHDPAAQPRFYSWFGNTFGMLYFFDEGKQTVNLASLSKSKLSSLPVPLPEVEEQAEIVRRVDILLSVAHQLAGRIDAATAQVERTQGAVITKAFRGELSGAGAR